MKRSIGVLFTLLAAGAALAGCNNGNNGNVNPPPIISCGNPPSNLQVLWPKPGARRVNPINVTAIYVATKGPLVSGNQYDFQLLGSDSSSQYTVNQSGQPISSPGSGFFSINASQIPIPHASPLPGNTTYYATALTTAVGPVVTFNILWNDAGKANCTPTVLVSSFATN